MTEIILSIPATLARGQGGLAVSALDLQAEGPGFDQQYTSSYSTYHGLSKSGQGGTWLRTAASQGVLD